MRSIIVGGFMVFALAGALDALTGENLLVTVPSGYAQAFQQKTTQGEIHEYLPAGQTVQKWNEMITVQLLSPQLRNESFYANFAGAIQKACPGVQMKVVATAMENGYPVKVFQLWCPANPQTNLGEVTFVKTIQGTDKFYVVQKAWRTPKFTIQQAPLSQAEAVQWIKYLQGISVCDSRIPQRRCP